MPGQPADQKLARLIIRAVSPLALLCITLCILTAGLDWWITKQHAIESGQEAALQDAGKRLGIPPTKDALAEYFTSRVHAGMSRDQVYREAAQMLPYHVNKLGFGPEPCWNTDKDLLVETLSLLIGKDDAVVFATCYDASDKLDFIIRDPGSP